MNIRQKIMKHLYPVIMRLSKLSKNKIITNINNTIPLASFFNLKATTNKKEKLQMDAFKGKYILIVNTASDCGFTNQYDELQKLYDIHKNTLIILAFPANDFKQQEKGTDSDIADFCKINYGISFPIIQKSIVIKNEHQNEVYQWLSSASKNGWNNQSPTWNFSKYLLNKEGVLTHYFEPSISPLSKLVTDNLK